MMALRLRPRRLLALLLVGACGFDGSGLGTDTEGGSAGESDDADEGAPTSTPSDPGTPTGSGGGETCGDGTLDPGEDCDDGPANADDAACKSDCTPATCGDGHVGPGEACDDGNAVAGDGCSACASESCGDGMVQGGEVCDDGNQLDSDACTSLCVLAYCGDGHLYQGFEECDDGNLVDDDACSAMCKAVGCGDGVVQAGEACDDGNTTDDDVCTNQCQLFGRRAFVSSKTFQGNLGGVAGADAKCQAMAAAAGLGGQWMAWISEYDDNTSPQSRFPGQFPGPYYAVGGPKIADSWDDLVDGTLDAPLDRHETGAQAPGGDTEVWTNTSPDGGKIPGDYECYDWTDNGFQDDANGEVGSYTQTDEDWTELGNVRPCQDLKRIYCFEQ